MTTSNLDAGTNSNSLTMVSTGPNRKPNPLGKVSTTWVQVAKQKRGMSEHEVGTQEEQMARQSMAVDRDDQTCKEGGEQIVGNNDDAERDSFFHENGKNECTWSYYVSRTQLMQRNGSCHNHVTEGIFINGMSLSFSTPPRNNNFFFLLAYKQVKAKTLQHGKFIHVEEGTKSKGIWAVQMG